MAKAAPDYTSRSYWNGIIKMSLSKFFILRVLHERPMHGYEIAQAVERTTIGCCSPSEGAIYPALKEFETGGYVVSETEVVSGRERRVYTLTDKGRDAFRTAVDAWMEITDSLQAARDVVDRPRAAAGGCCG